MQVMVAGTVMLVGSSWGVIKFIKPFIDQLSPKTVESKTNVTVLAADLADTKSVAMLTHSLDRLNETQEKNNILMKMVYEALVKLTLKI